MGSQGMRTPFDFPADVNRAAGTPQTPISHHMKMYRIPRHLLALPLALTIATGRLPAQTTAGTAPETITPKEESVLVLSPFIVTTEKDKGYKATNSTSGTRLNTEIKDLPLNLEVITADFIRDTGATDLRQALRYSAGVVLESQSDALTEQDFDSQSAGANDPRGNTRRAGDSVSKLRGFLLDQVLRDGFRRVRTADSINIDRVEVLRGPSALLYGVGNFGGVINYIPKKPLQSQKTYMGLSVDSNGLYRSEFDFTGPLGDGNHPWKPAFRITGAYQEAGDHTDHYNRRAYMIDPIFSFQPFAKTLVTIEAEVGHENQTGVGFQNIRSNLNTGAARTASWLTDVSQGLINTRTFRWSGPDTYLKGPYSNLVLDVQQQIGDNIFAKVGASRTKSIFDSRQISDVGTVTQPFSVSDKRNYDPMATVTIGGTAYNLATAIGQAGSSGTFQGMTAQQLYAARPAGAFRGDKLYGFVVQNRYQDEILPGPPATSTTAAIRYRWVDSDKEETRDQVRADLSYNLDLGRLGQHSFIAGMQYMHLTSVQDEYSTPYSYTGRPVDNIARYSYKNPGDYSVFRYGVQGDGTADATRTHLYHDEVETWDLGFYGVWQGRFWKDRITTVAGIRRDRNDSTNIRRYIYETTKAADDNSRSVFSAKAPTATSPQAGITFAVTRDISLFGLYSTAVSPNYTAQDGNGEVFAPTKVKNREVGLKFDLLNGKVSGTVSAFRTERKGTPRFLWWAPSPYKSLQKGYDPTKPSATVWWHSGPEAIWYALRNTSGGLTQAKKIYSSAWWPALEAMASKANRNDIYSIPDVANWWSYNTDANGNKGLTRDAEVNTGNSAYVGTRVFPLINVADQATWEFVNAAKFASGQWGGNFYYTAGAPYYFGDGTNGTKGVGNAPDGSGASVPIDDKATGWDATMIFSITNELQVTLNYSHLKREITSETYKFVKAPYWPFGPWYTKDGYYGTLSYAKSAAEVYTDVTDSSTYHAQIPDYGEAADDTPANVASMWVRYNLDKVLPFKGLTLGVGGQAPMVHRLHWRWRQHHPGVPRWHQPASGTGAALDQAPHHSQRVRRISPEAE
jgi:iron complex outermembrane recepter protein